MHINEVETGMFWHGFIYALVCIAFNFAICLSVGFYSQKILQFGHGTGIERGENQGQRYMY